MSKRGSAEKRKVVKLLEGMTEFQQAMSNQKNTMSEEINSNADVKGRVLCCKKNEEKKAKTSFLLQQNKHSGMDS